MYVYLPNNRLHSTQTINKRYVNVNTTIILITRFFLYREGFKKFIPIKLN